MSPSCTVRKPWFVRLARTYVRSRLGRQFDGLFVEGLTAARDLANREPVIVAATHVAWWDALVAVQLDSALGVESYCLMDTNNLGQHPFFGWLGAVPLDASASRRTLSDLRAAATLLDRPGRALWIFPQGRQRAAHLRPLQLQAGVRWLSRSSGASVIPLALTYAYRTTPVPAIVASFGAALPADTGDIMSGLEQQLSASLARIDQFVDRGVGDFTPLLRPRHLRAQAVPPAGRLLSRFARASRFGARGGESGRSR